MTTDADPFSNPEPANPEDLGNAPVDFTQPGGATSTAGTEWEETGGRRKMPHPVTGVPTWFTRASKMGGWIAEQFTLTEWKIANAVAGVCHNADLRAKGASILLPPIEAREKGWWMPWAPIGHEAMDRIGASSGAHLGTAVHRFREQVDAGTRRIEDVPEEWRPHVEASERRRVALGMEIVRSEAFVANLKVHNGASGRLDNLLRGPDGRLVIEDLKTGKNVPMGLDEIAIQLAIYANADWYYDVQTKAWLPMPNVRKDVAIVTWVPIDRPDEAETIIIDIAWGWAAANVAGWVQGYRNRGKRKGDGLRLPLAALSEPERAPDWRTLLPGAGVVQVPFTAFPGGPRIGDARVTMTDEGLQVTGDMPREALMMPVPDPTCAADGSPLQPLATGTQRGCSVCRRIGHRRGSAKCLGDQDPDRVPASVTPNVERYDAPNAVTPGSYPEPEETDFENHRPDAAKDADEEHWMRPVDGDARSVKDMEPHSPDHEVTGEQPPEPLWCTCTSRAAGWTRDPETDAWVCGDCGLPSRAALMHEAAGRPARPAEHSAFTADEAQVLLDARQEPETEPEPSMIDGDGMLTREGHEQVHEAAMRRFAGAHSDAKKPTATDRIEAASTLEDLSNLYLELYPAGLWTAELDALAQRRRAEIKGEVPTLRSV
jgi:hypothetical protein